MRPGVPLAWKNLTHDKRRFAVSLAGIAFAVLLMFVELGFWNAMLDAAVGLLRQCNGELVIVSKSTYSLAIRESFSTKRLAQVHDVPGVSAAFPLYFESTNSLWRDTDNGDGTKPRTHPIRVIAFDPEYDAFRPADIRAQRHLLGRGDNEIVPVLLDSLSKEDYGKREAHIVRELSRKKIEVVGTFALGADFTTDGNVIMSARDFARFYPNPLAPYATLSLAHLGLIQIAEGADPWTIKQALTDRLPDDVRVLTMDEFIAEERAFWQNATPVGFIFTFGLVIGVIVGMVICSQVLQADVTSHLKEYATLKAMGYTGGYLTWVVLQEALWLGVLGFLPSFTLCLFLYGYLSTLTDLPLYLTASRVAVVFVLTCFMCVVAGILAVRKVQQSDPAEVF
jgi:putative ABC transport system permease protein